MSSDKGLGYVGEHQEDEHGSPDPCVVWTTVQNWDHTMTGDIDNNQLGNYCRNPDVDDGVTWCWTASDWEFCNLPACDTLSGDYCKSLIINLNSSILYFVIN